ncbi:MAG: hypothetical protein EBS93_07600 [Chitinophagia bacterium]|nr:hypothetical protein [Chitinophagia bacterium]
MKPEAQLIFSEKGITINENQFYPWSAIKDEKIESVKISTTTHYIAYFYRDKATGKWKFHLSRRNFRNTLKFTHPMGTESVDMRALIYDEKKIHHLLEIAKRSKGTPRILNARLLWYKNFTSCESSSVDVNIIFDSQGIDYRGLDMYDRLYLDILTKNKGNPLGLKSISSLTGIAIETIENSIEPYLLREGYVVRTQKGRIIGKNHEK